MALTLERLQAQRAKRRKQLERALKGLVRKLKEMGALKIVVFGSFISGTIRRWSYLDVLVVMPKTRSEKEWFKEIHDKVDASTAADILPFTQEELKKKIETSSFVRHALKTGKVLHEKG